MEGDTAQPREDLVVTAINFLRNPKVAQTSLEQRKEFLRKKGLMEEEIEQAVVKSGAVEPAPVSPSQPSIIPRVVPGTPVSVWTRARDFASSAILIGGITYAAYQFYKKFVAPWLFGPSEDQLRQEAIQKTLVEIQKTLAESLAQLQQSVTSLRTSIEDDLASDRRQDRDSQFTNEIKTEISSLKSLLLSRKQFPSMPATNPVLPQWQLNATSQIGPKQGGEASPADTHVSPADQPSTSNPDQDMVQSGHSESDTLAAKPGPQDTDPVSGQLVMNGEHSGTENGQMSVANGEQAMNLSIANGEQGAEASFMGQVTPTSDNDLVTQGNDLAPTSDNDLVKQDNDPVPNTQSPESETAIAKLKDSQGGVEIESVASEALDGNTNKKMPALNGSGDTQHEVTDHEHS